MMTKYIQPTQTALAAALMALTLTACSLDNDVDEVIPGATSATDDAAHGVTLALSTLLEGEADGGSVVTRSVNDPQNTAFEANKFIDVYVSESGGTGTSYTQPLVVKTATTQAETGLTNYNKTTFVASASATAAESKQYWPTSGNGLKVFAWYPNGKAGTGTSFNFTVATAQGTDDSYKANDLMYGQTATEVTSPPTVAWSSGIAQRRPGNDLCTVPMKFSHKLSKIKVILKAFTGTGSTMTTAKLKGATVTLMRVYTKSGAITRDGGNTPYTGASVVGDVVMGTLSTTDVTDTNEASRTLYAIIPPQITPNSGDNTAYIKIQLAGATTGSYYKYAINNVTYTSGNMYTYTITIKPAELQVSTAIDPWGSGSNLSGDGTFN